MGTMVTLAYVAVLIMIWVSLFEPIKTFMESDSGQFWRKVTIYVVILFLAVCMPIFCLGMVLRKDPKMTSNERWVIFCVGVVITLVAYPLVAHAIGTISDTGLNLVQFKQSVVAMIDFESTEPNWYSLWYCSGLFVYGLAAAFAIVFGIGIGIMLAVGWGWCKAIELVLDFPKEDE